MDTVELARRIVVRHREAGYLRLELPAEICHPAAGAALEAALRAVAGVRRAELHAAARRLVIDYDAHYCSAAEVARALKAALGELPPAPERPVSAAAPGPDAGGVAVPDAVAAATCGARRLADELRARLDALRRAPAPAGGLAAKLQPMLANALTEKAAINFLNDLVAFYLVKVHWQLITQRWLKEPAKHADAWLAAFYLAFLLVRYRKSLAAPSLPTAPAASAAPAAPDPSGAEER